MRSHRDQPPSPSTQSPLRQRVPGSMPVIAELPLQDRHDPLEPRHVTRGGARRGEDGWSHVVRTRGDGGDARGGQETTHVILDSVKRAEKGGDPELKPTAMQCVEHRCTCVT